MPDIEDELRKLLAEHLKVPYGKIKADSKIMGDLGADSLDTIEILMTIEEKFDVSIDDVSWENVSTFAEMLALLRLEMTAQHKPTAPSQQA